MKKKLLLVLSLLLIFTLAACSPAEETPAPENVEETKEVTEEPAEEAAAENEAEESEEAVDEEGGTMVFAIGSDPTIVNPLYADDRVSLTIAKPLFEALYDVKGEDVTYVLAESMEPSEDYLSYTLKLKEGIKWHDGEEFTADDVIFTLETVLNPDQGAKHRSNLLFGEEELKFEKVDEYTVQFTLPEVNIPFVNTIASIRPIPKHIFEGQEDVGKAIANQSPIGTGAFKFSEHKSGETYTLVRNEEYHGEKAKLDSIVYRVIADPNATLLALEKGEISAAYIQSNTYDQFKNNENFDLYTYDEGMVTNVFMRVSNPKLEDVRVRQAIAYALDKKTLIDGAYGGETFAKPAYSVFSNNTAYYTEDVEKFEQDLDKAKALLQDAGVDSLDLVFMYTAGNTRQEKEGVLIQEMLKEVNINVELMPLERGTFIEKLLDRENMDFDIAANGYVMGTQPYGYMSLFLGDSQNNFSGYNNPKVDELFNQGAKETDEAKRKEIFEEVQRILAEEVVQYSIVNTNSIVAVNKEFKGIEEAVPAPIHMFDYLSKIHK